MSRDVVEFKNVARLAREAGVTRTHFSLFLHGWRKSERLAAFCAARGIRPVVRKNRAINMRKEKELNIAAVMAADVPLPISSVAEIYGLSRATIKEATETFKVSQGKMGLRCFTPPGSAKVRIRPSAVKDWFAQLEECEVI